MALFVEKIGNLLGCFDRRSRCMLLLKIKIYKEKCDMNQAYKNKVDQKKFVRYKEGAKMYSMSQSKFENVAKDAGAVYKLNKMVLVNIEIFEMYLETFRVVE